MEEHDSSDKAYIKRLSEQVEAFRKSEDRYKSKLNEMVSAMRLLQQGEGDPVRKIFIGNAIKKAEDWSS
jgi:hypothetical protein